MAALWPDVRPAELLRSPPPVEAFQARCDFARRAIEVKELGDQLFLRETHRKVLRVLEQAEALTQRYHVVVTNPPYMGVKPMNTAIQELVTEKFALHDRAN